MRRMLLPAFVAVTIGLSPVRALGQGLDFAASSATDAVAKHPFILNPAALDAKGTQFGLGAALRNAYSERRNDDSSGEIEIASGQRRILGLACATNASGGLAMGLEANQTTLESAESQSSADTDTAYTSQYLAARLALAITSGLRGGLVIHGYSLDAKKLRFEDGVSSNSQGTMVGLGAGIQFGKDKQRLGLYYLPAMRGGVEAEGEHRVIATTGLMGADLTFPWSGETTAGASIKVWRSDTSEGVDAMPTGVEYGEGREPAFLAALGWQRHFGSGYLNRATIEREGYKGDDAEFVESQATRLKFAFGLVRQEFESSVAVSALFSPNRADHSPRVVPLAFWEYALLHSFKF